MMRIAAVVLLGLSGLIIAQETCPAGLYGEDCNNICVGCVDDKGCDKSTGVCTTKQCAEGYEAVKDEVCQPKCFGSLGNAGCDNSGECVAPNYCICGKSGAQVVGVFGTYNGEEGTQCISLRKTGIWGALYSLVIMVISISFCGLVEYNRNKGKSKKD